MAETMYSDSVVIIPTYNEKENIEKIIRAVLALDKDFHVLVIDDGSPDGTADIVKRLMVSDYPHQLFILERQGKLGLGTAYIAGFKWALNHGYEYIFEMDADFSHDPNDLPRLYAACHDEGYDVAIGSRYISGVNVVNWPIGRVLMSYFVIFPISFRFLGTYQVAERIHSTITLDSYISTFTTLTLLMGVVFQLPVIAFILGKMGVVTAEMLKQYRKHAFLIIMFVAAVITPPDLMTLLLVSVPLYLLYEVSIRVIKISGR